VYEQAGRASELMKPSMAWRVGFEGPARKRGIACLNNALGYLQPRRRIGRQIRMAGRMGFEESARKRRALALLTSQAACSRAQKAVDELDWRRGWDSNPLALWKQRSFAAQLGLLSNSKKATESLAPLYCPFPPCTNSTCYLCRDSSMSCTNRVQVSAVSIRLE
jgi:hypothetical protein